MAGKAWPPLCQLFLCKTPVEARHMRTASNPDLKHVDAMIQVVGTQEVVSIDANILVL